MKTKDFLKEDIVSAAAEMHQDHEVQMARKDCYAAADDAIALHKLLRNITEAQGLEGWVAAKITLAADYLNTVREHLEYQMMSSQEPAQEMEMPIAEASTINGKKQDDKELVWKQTGMSYEKAVEKYGKEHVKKGAKNRLGKETVEVHVPLVAEDGGTSSGSVASSMGGGNGFVNGGPGTVKRVTTKKAKK